MENLPAVRSSIPSEHEMMVFNVMSKQAVESKMYKGIGDQAGVMMIMLSARELGIPPMQALNGALEIIQGRIEISAKMMGAMIRRAGHDFVPIEEDETKCVIWGKRGDNGRELTVTFTLAQAQKAGLVKPGGGWSKWLSDMLYSRALSRLARRLFGDVILMAYVEGEIKIKECEVIPSMPIEPENHEELLQSYLNIFDILDHKHALEYLKVVENHFSWSTSQAIKELLKDIQKLQEKFNVWKNKHLNVEKK